MSQAVNPQPGSSQGILCLGSNIARFVNQVGQVSGAGVFAHSIDLSAIPQNPTGPALVGQSWSFQLWHRDSNPNLDQQLLPPHQRDVPLKNGGTVPGTVHQYSVGGLV